MYPSGMKNPPENPAMAFKMGEIRWAEPGEERTTKVSRAIQVWLSARLITVT